MQTYLKVTCEEFHKSLQILRLGGLAKLPFIQRKSRSEGMTLGHGTESSV